jgi:hypothetical protein
VFRGHSARGRAAYRKAFIRILAVCRVVQAQRLYHRTVAAIFLQAISKRVLCRDRHGLLLLAGHSLASVSTSCVKRRAFVYHCIRSRAGACASSAGRRAVARHLLATMKHSAVTAQSLTRQSLLRSLYVRICAADLLKRYCFSKRAVAAKRLMILKNTAAFKILLARRRCQFYRRWYNRLVGRSVRVMQYACIRAVAQHKVTFRIASSSLARFVIARVARSRHARLPPAVGLLSLSFARKSSSTKYLSLRTQTRASVALKAALKCSLLRILWARSFIAAKVVARRIRAVIPRASFRNAVAAVRLQALTRCCV